MRPGKIPARPIPYASGSAAIGENAVRLPFCRGGIRAQMPSSHIRASRIRHSILRRVRSVDPFLLVLFYLLLAYFSPLSISISNILI